MWDSCQGRLLKGSHINPRKNKSDPVTVLNEVGDPTSILREEMEIQISCLPCWLLVLLWSNIFARIPFFYFGEHMPLYD